MKSLTFRVVLGLQWLHGTLYIEIIEAEHLPGDPTLVSVRPLQPHLFAATDGNEKSNAVG